MKERPILYSTPMIQAKLAGRKTQTRRILKQDWLRCLTVEDDYDQIISLCPFGQVGDWLWSRETFCLEKYFNGLTEGCFVRYKADLGPEPVSWNWKPSIFQPKEYSRIWEEITEIRVERLQDISEEDAIAEGVEFQWCDLTTMTCFYKYYADGTFSMETARDSYKTLWESINGPESWELNPFVWVITTKILSTTGKPQLP